MESPQQVTHTNGKFLAAGLKRLLRESGLPLTSAVANLQLTTDNGHRLELSQSGVPPFTTTVIAVDDDVRTYQGYYLAPRESDE